MPTERLARVEALLEQVAERQAEQHAENRRAQEAAEVETRDHRHRAANAMQALDGRLRDVAAASAAQGDKIATLVAASLQAATERKTLDARLRMLETIVTVGKGSWKVLAALAALVSIVLTIAMKLSQWLGWKV